ncbi:MAG: c-type cytochrome [Paucimonas sp.]|nr:c-type cytochrome [Paucimonas sp.]
MGCLSQIQTRVRMLLARRSHEILAPVKITPTLLLLASLLGASLSAGAQQATARADAFAQRVAPCLACHKTEGMVTRDGYFPRIAGKPSGYLFNQLRNFREGRRNYPLMTYTVAHLSDDYLREMANYFGAIDAPYPPPVAAAVDKAALERGRLLTVQGDAARKLPACAACHGERLTGMAPAIPGLLGLPRDYLNAQFGAWRNGSRRAAAPDCMAQLTQSLTPDDVNAVSAWLSSQPVPANSHPQAMVKTPLPLECGSIAEVGR